VPRLPRLSVAALGLALIATACDQPKPAADPWGNAGFIRHVRADAEGFLSIRRPAVALEALRPAWDALSGDKAVQAAWERSTWGTIFDGIRSVPEATQLAAAVPFATTDEVFVVLGPGTAGQLADLQRIKRLFDAASIRNLFTPPGSTPPEAPEAELFPQDDLNAAAMSEVLVPMPPAMEAALKKFVQDAAVPPVMLGIRLPAGDNALPDFLDGWVKRLPEKVPRDTVRVEPFGDFTRVRVPVASLVQREPALRARALLAAHIGDPFTATYIIRDLLAKTTVVTFGRVHDCFVVTLGADSVEPFIEGNFDQSLAATPDLGHLRPLLGPDVAATFYASTLITGLAASPPPVGEYLDAALDAALEFAPAERIRPLREAAATLRTEADALFQPRVSATAGLVRKDGPAWRADLFGGSLAPRLASANAPALLASAPAMALLWTEHWQDGYAPRLVDFGGDVASFTADWLDALGPVFLDPAKLARARALIRAIEPPADTIRQSAADLLGRALGNDVALAVSLDGRMPGPPFVDAAAAKAGLPRLAIAAGLRDRTALDSLWSEIRTAKESSLGRPWPAPISSALTNGGVTYSYPLPLAGPDLAVAAAVANNRWVLGTSEPFTRVLAAADPASGDKPSVQAVRLRTRALGAFTASWAEALAANPTLASLVPPPLPSDPGTLKAMAAFLSAPHLFDYAARWEDNTLHRTLSITAEP
jgi:hypothetical protein